MQNVRSALHDLAVVLCGVCVLSVGDGVHESIQVLVVLSQKIGLHELHHAVVCGQSKKKRDFVSFCHFFRNKKLRFYYHTEALKSTKHIDK